MKFSVKQDTYLLWNLVGCLTANIVFTWLHYDFFTRHIVHRHPQLFIGILFTSSLLLMLASLWLKLFMPLKLLLNTFLASEIAIFSVFFIDAYYSPAKQFPTPIVDYLAVFAITALYVLLWFGPIILMIGLIYCISIYMQNRKQQTKPV